MRRVAIPLTRSTGGPRVNRRWSDGSAGTVPVSRKNFSIWLVAFSVSASNIAEPFGFASTLRACTAPSGHRCPSTFTSNPSGMAARSVAPLNFVAGVARIRCPSTSSSAPLRNSA